MLSQSFYIDFFQASIYNDMQKDQIRTAQISTIFFHWAEYETALNQLFRYAIKVMTISWKQ